MTVLKPTPVSTSQFTPDGPFLVAEASDLGFPPGGGFGRVYDDAADLGLTLVCPGGREIVYAVEHEESRDGELLYWDLRPVSNNHRNQPTIRVFND